MKINSNTESWLPKKKETVGHACHKNHSGGSFTNFPLFPFYSNITVFLVKLDKNLVNTLKFRMADLDDFFAKKDRKKSKSVKKFATADELAKKLEEPKQKTDVRPKKERPVQEGEESGRVGVRIRLQMFLQTSFPKDFHVSKAGALLKFLCSAVKI